MTQITRMGFIRVIREIRGHMPYFLNLPTRQIVLVVVLRLVLGLTFYALRFTHFAAPCRQFSLMEMRVFAFINPWEKHSLHKTIVFDAVHALCPICIFARDSSMTGYGFFKSLRGIFVLVLFLVGSWLAVARLGYEELSTEAEFRRTYGANWRTEFEQVHGSLLVAHAKLAGSGVGFLAVGALVVWLSKLLRPDYHWRRSSGKRRQRHRYGSRLEHAVACRRKALLRIYFGLAGIIAGVLLVIFRSGLSSDHANELVLGVFVFLAGYAGVIAGCSFWLKAKQQNDAIVFIGLAPLAIPLIPFVRLVLLAVPALILCAMVMMPLILLVVVAVLPDQSGSSRRGLWRDTTRGDFPRDESMSDDSYPVRPNPPGGAHGRKPLISQTNRTSEAADSDASS